MLPIFLAHIGSILTTSRFQAGCHPPRLQKLQELHADLAKESPQGVHIVAHESGHAIQLDQPELVIDAIRQVVEKVRCSSDP